jgi:probable rRNA maturation factor
MTAMKKHLFLNVDYTNSVNFSTLQKRQLDEWLYIAGDVLQEMIKKKIISAIKVKKVHVSLLICGDARIRDLNFRFRQKDKVTDVLSFPAHHDLRSIVYSQSELFLGDLAICHSQTKRQAKKFKIRYMDEFIHLFFHGVIHLMGYDHEISEKEQKIMDQWEQRALKKFSEIKDQKKGV